jgi:hypothetical protein
MDICLRSTISVSQCASLPSADAIKMNKVAIHSEPDRDAELRRNRAPDGLYRPGVQRSILIESTGQRGSQ